MSPKTLRSHKTTAMTTTAFKIDLMDPAIGMYELTSQRRTPTTTKTNITWTKGMIYSSSMFGFQKSALSFNFGDWTCNETAAHLRLFKIAAGDLVLGLNPKS
jgi:hypothetical protein